MEYNMLITVLITIVSVGILSTLVYLVSTVRSLKARAETLAREMIDFHTQVDNQEVNHAREHEKYYDDVNIRFDRIHRKVDKSRDDLYGNIERLENSLPEKIRRVIGHIEYARPLDNTK
jgi:predicted Holliday junction resolvase-like endonuclease